MEINIINIGNSKGIVLSKKLLKQYSIADKVILIEEADGIKILPELKPRTNWEASFKKMNELKDDELLINDVFSDEDFEEWK